MLLRNNPISPAATLDIHAKENGRNLFWDCKGKGNKENRQIRSENYLIFCVFSENLTNKLLKHGI
jgi:hypothetical protein